MITKLGLLSQHPTATSRKTFDLEAGEAKRLPLPNVIRSNPSREDCLRGQEDSAPGESSNVLCNMRCNCSLRSLDRYRWPYATFVARLWWPLRYIIADPRETAIVFFLACSLLTGLGKISSVFAQLVTWFGVASFSALGLWGIILTAARSLAFPGYLSLVCRSMETEVCKKAAELHLEVLSVVSDLLTLTDESPDFSAKIRSVDAALKRGFLKLTLAALKHMQSVGRLSVAGHKYLGPLEELVQVLEQLRPDIENIMTMAAGFAEVSKRNRAVFLSRLEDVSDEISRLTSLLGLNHPNTLFHVPKGSSDDEYLNSNRNSEQETEVGEGEDGSVLSSQDLELEMPDSEKHKGTNDARNSGGERAASRRANDHWLVSLCKTIFEFLSSWHAARQPLDVVFNIAFLRSELIVRYAAEEGWVEGVDAVYFPPPSDGNAIGEGSAHSDAWASLNGAGEAEAARLAAEEAQQKKIPTKIVIMCFPNAGVLEFIHYQSDWLPFYLSCGFGVVLSNYRGYGPVAGAYGRPYPRALKRDAASILAAVKAKFPDAKVMVHGESMGGMVACSLASQSLGGKGDFQTDSNARNATGIELCYVDRTFRDLPSVGSTLLKFGWIERVMRLTVPWDTDNVRDWLSIPCPKLCANDPNDSMIADKSCLKAGVAAKICEDAIDSGQKWAARRGARLAIWNDPEGTACSTLCGAWNALRTLLAANAVRDPLVIRKVLSLVYSCDGRQNKVLGEAMHDRVDANGSVQRWAQCLLVWGPVSRTPDQKTVLRERLEKATAALVQHGYNKNRAMAAARETLERSSPKPLDMVYHEVYDALTKGAAGPQGAEALKLLAEIIGELKVAYSARMELEEETANVQSSSVAGGIQLSRLGHLLPLRCGHNMPLRSDEMTKVKEFLSKEDWI